MTTTSSETVVGRYGARDRIDWYTGTISFQSWPQDGASE